MKRTVSAPILDFPQDSLGQYWYLVWIGGIFYKDEQFYATFYFVNVLEPSHHTKHIVENTSYKLDEPFNNIVFFPVGSIFNSDGKLEFTPDDYPFKKRHRIIGASDRYRTTSQKLPFSFKDSEYPFPNDECLESFCYFKHSSRNYHKEKVHVIFPVYVLCKYLYFMSTRIIDHLIGYELGDVVDFSTVAKYKVEDGKTLGYLKYDSQRLDHDEIEALAPYLFYRNDNGAKALQMIGASIMKEVINHNKNPIYPDTLFPFNEKSTLKVHGQSFKADGENYFMVYGVSSLQPDVRTNVEVDSFFCEPFIEENPVSDKGNEEKLEVVKNKAYNTKKKLKISTGRKSSNSFHGTKSFNYKPQDFLKYDIPIKFKKKERVDVQYKVIANFVQKDLKGLSSNLRNYDSESEMLRSVFKRQHKIFDRYDYVRKIASLLNLENSFDTEYVYFKSKNTSRRTTYITIGEEVYQCMIISIKHESNHFYLMEFDRNYTGLICDTDFYKIEERKLMILAGSIVREFMVKFNYFWTKVSENHLFQKRHDIQVLTSVKHQYNKKETIEEVAEWGAKKILKRIKRISA